MAASSMVEDHGRGSDEDDANADLSDGGGGIWTTASRGMGGFSSSGDIGGIAGPSGRSSEGKSEDLNDETMWQQLVLISADLRPILADKTRTDNREYIWVDIVILAAVLGVGEKGEEVTRWTTTTDVTSPVEESSFNGSISRAGLVTVAVEICQTNLNAKLQHDGDEQSACPDAENGGFALNVMGHEVFYCYIQVDHSAAYYG
ncbi:hypothetical protein K438DRAFT_1786083 [Mycena galopus ATCC 62051]|nr:hypothetical protein K438DRAFT_1786083 [Mycena galopus ATCC 62051]